MSVSDPKQVKQFDDLVGSRGNWADTGKPSMEDFIKNRVAVRNDIFENVLEQLKNKPFCVISGPRDSGKTWLCYKIGFELQKRNKGFRYVDLDDAFNAYEIWSYMKKWGHRTDEEFFFVIENCHNNKEEVRELVTYVSNDPENRRFIFTGCDTQALQSLGNKAHWIRLRTEGNECSSHVKDIIEKFILAKEVRQYVEVTDEDIEAMAQKWNDDLYSVFLRLTEGWDFAKKKMKLTQVGDNSVYESILNVNGKLKLGLPERRDIFLPLAAICQFESASVWSDYLQKIDKEKKLGELVDKGLIGRITWQGKSFITIEAGKASWILRAISYGIGEKGPEYVGEEVLKTFKDYIMKESPNWSYVLYCVRVSKETPALVKDFVDETQLPSVEPLIGFKRTPEPLAKLLSSIIEDEEVWRAMKDMIEANRFFSISWLPSFSRTLIIVRQPEKEQEIAQYILRKESSQMLRELSDCRISVINAFLSFVKQRNETRFKELAEKLDIRGSKLARWPESSVQSKCTLCFLIFDWNPLMSALIAVDVQKQLKEGTANVIRQTLPHVNRIHRIITLEQFFEDFTPLDWENIIKNSPTLTPIFRLFAHDFRRWHLQKTSVLIAQTLIGEDLAYLVYEKGADLYTIRGIINAAYDLGVEINPLVESIILADDKTLKSLYSNGKNRGARWSEEEDFGPPEGAFLVALNGIALRAINRADEEPQIKRQTDQRIACFLGMLAGFGGSDLKEIFRDVESVNHFFFTISWKAPDACRSIIKKIGFDAWLDLLQSTLRQEKPEKVRAFWLLWNIFRYDESLAKQLAEKSAGIFSENVKKGRLSEVSLSLTGLLHHLKVSVDGILQRTDLERASETLDFLKNEEPPGHSALILLSFVALKSRIPRDKFEALKVKIMEDPAVKRDLCDHWDTQLQGIFNKLKRAHGL